MPDILLRGLTGATGAKGDKGDPGLTGSAGSQGLQGIRGEQGLKGDTGTAATITLGTVTTGEPGTAVQIVNSGATASAAKFDFTIPKGTPGVGGTGNKYIMGQYKSATVTTSTALDFVNYTTTSTHTCDQFNPTTGVYTCPEDGFYTIYYGQVMGNVTTRTQTSLVITNGEGGATLNQIVIDLINQANGVSEGSTIIWCPANAQIKLRMSFAASSTNVTARFACCML